MYIYESHHGGHYASDRLLPHNKRYCEECGDSDTLVGEYDPDDIVSLSDKSAVAFIIYLIESGYWNIEGIVDDICSCFNIPETSRDCLTYVVSSLMELSELNNIDDE